MEYSYFVQRGSYRHHQSQLGVALIMQHCVLILKINLCGGYYCLHFTDEETETQNDKITCPRSGLSKWDANPVLNCSIVLPCHDQLRLEEYSIYRIGIVITILKYIFIIFKVIMIIIATTICRGTIIARHCIKVCTNISSLNTKSPGRYGYSGGIVKNKRVKILFQGQLASKWQSHNLNQGL